MNKKPSKRHFLDGTWIPEAPFECYNATKQGENNCEGCIMKERTPRIIRFSHLQNRNIEIIDREECIWFRKMLEANWMYLKVQELKMRIQEINKMSEISDSGKLKNVI